MWSKVRKIWIFQNRILAAVNISAQTMEVSSSLSKHIVYIMHINPTQHGEGPSLPQGLSVCAKNKTLSRFNLSRRGSFRSFPALVESTRKQGKYCVCCICISVDPPHVFFIEGLGRKQVNPVRYWFKGTGVGTN